MKRYRIVTTYGYFQPDEIDYPGYEPGCIRDLYNNNGVEDPEIEVLEDGLTQEEAVRHLYNYTCGARWNSDEVEVHEAWAESYDDSQPRAWDEPEWYQFAGITIGNIVSDWEHFGKVTESGAYHLAGDALNGIELDELHQNGDIDDDVWDILAMPQTCNLRYKILYMGPLTKRPDL